MSQAARVRGSVGPEESVGRVLICADGLCNSRDHMTVTSRPAQRLSAPTNSLTSHPFKHKWVTLMEETRGGHTPHKPTFLPLIPPPPCSCTHHSIFSVATQIRSVNWTPSERGGGEECHRDPKPPKNREAQGRTARWLWIVYDPAGRQHNESAGSTRARPWRDGDEAFVLGAGAASQKVKEKMKWRQGIPGESAVAQHCSDPITTVASHKGLPGPHCPSFSVIHGFGDGGGSVNI